ncbi:MAG: DUF1643 domain-containing protein [Gammaproteobacteria bacterium]|nr:MAG: DUF1643 domain-containing protein [Gammaproteobacteria bacterium]
MIKETIFSPCRNYRYTLYREWAPGDKVVMFVGLNPSTADEVQNDPTVRRCINYAKGWGYDGMYMANIFAFRATDPAVMKAHHEPVGRENDHYLQQMAQSSSVIVAAWGTHGAHLGRGDEVKKLIRGLHCLRLTKDGHPGHPLYLPKNLMPVKF